MSRRTPPAPSDLTIQILGDAIREARESVGWSQDALATVMGVTPGAVSRWETNKAMPVTSQARWLADFMGVEIVPAARVTPMTREGLANLERAVRSRTESLLAEASKHLKERASALPQDPTPPSRAGRRTGRSAPLSA